MDGLEETLSTVENSVSQLLQSYLRMSDLFMTSKEYSNHKPQRGLAATLAKALAVTVQWEVDVQSKNKHVRGHINSTTTTVPHLQPHATRPVVCWSCHTGGHVYRACPARNRWDTRRRFAPHCWECGRKGHVRRTCWSWKERSPTTKKLEEVAVQTQLQEGDTLYSTVEPADTSAQTLPSANSEDRSLICEPLNVDEVELNSEKLADDPIIDIQTDKNAPQEDKEITEEFSDLLEVKNHEEECSDLLEIKNGEEPVVPQLSSSTSRKKRKKKKKTHTEAVIKPKEKCMQLNIQLACSSTLVHQGEMRLGDSDSDMLECRFCGQELSHASWCPLSHKR